jgi:putative tryptophan/tyrosine transport system substrate-binding protein
VKRREFIAALGSAAAWPVVARGQQSPMPVIGYLSTGQATSAIGSSSLAAFQQGLRGEGYVERQNVLIEARWANNQYERLPVLAADLVEHRVAAIYSGSLIATLAAKSATSTIPIVFGVGADPVKSGLVASFNRPGGNITGIAALIESLGPKRLEVLHELLPEVSSINVLVNSSNPTAQAQAEEIRKAAPNIAQVEVVNVGGKDELEPAFLSLAQKGARALLIVPDPVLINSREQVVALAARYRLPTVYPLREFADAGGLVSYGTDFAEAQRLAGGYVGKILKGTRPADLPIMQSIKVELVVNLKTAKTLGINFPVSLLGRADQVIE